MNKKNLVIVIVLLFIVMLVNSTIRAVAAKKGKVKEKYVDYELVAFLGPSEITYQDFSGAPELVIIEGYRLVEGIYEVTVTINDTLYTYPEDFNYIDIWHVEYNAITLEGYWEVELVLTFNLPGNPTIREWCVAYGTNLGYPDQVTAGSFILTGTGMFDKVKGEGLEEAWFIGTTFYAHRVGGIKDWPL